MPVCAAASSFALNQRGEACDSVLVISIARIVSPEAPTNGPTLALAKVLEVLKGPAHLKQVNASYASHGHFASPASKVQTGKDYIAFLSQVEGHHWVFEGAVGLEPVSSEYRVRRMKAGKIVTETLSHSNYLNAIRFYAQPIRVSISQLFNDRKRFLGKRVEVTGYYHSHFEYSGLYEQKEDMDKYVENPSISGAIHNGLWVMPFSKPGFEGKIQFTNDASVRIIGVFRYNVSQPDLGVGHLNGWPAELTSLELFEPVK